MAQTSTNNLVASSHCLVVREAGAAYFHLSASGRAALSGPRSRCHLTSAFRPSGATGAKAQRPMATQRGAKAPLFHDSIAMLFGAEEAAFPGPRSQPEQG